LEHVDSLSSAASVRRQAAPRRGFVRNAAVALVSVGVVAFLVAYALAAPTPDLRLTVSPVVPQPGATAVIQGRVLEPDADGLDGVRIEVRRRGAVSGSGISDGAGRFRVDLRGACGVYDVALKANWQGATLEQRARRRLCPGDALPLDARVVTQGHYLWVPGPR
jgi:hypothetical protein